MSWKDRIQELPSDGQAATPVASGSWRDRIQEVKPEEQAAPEFGATLDDDIARIAKEHGVDPDMLRSRQIGMGYYDPTTPRELENSNWLERTGKGVLANIHSNVGEGLLGGAPAWLAKKLSSDKEEAAIDALRPAVDHHKSGGQQVKEVLLSATPGALASKALAGASWAKKAAEAGSTGAKLTKSGYAAVAGANLAEGARSGVMESDAGEEGIEAVKAGLLTGGLMGGAEVIPRAAGAVGKLKKFIPGTEGAVTNGVTAKVAALNPFQSATAEQIEELLANPELRRKAAGVDLVKKASDLASQIGKAKSGLDESVSGRFRELENASLVPAINPQQDLDATESLMGKLGDSLTLIKENDKLYGPRVQKLYDHMIHIFGTGGPKEAGKSTYGKWIGDMEPGQAASAAKLRTLHARRHLDDFMKNKDWEKLSQYEKEAIEDARTSLDSHLKGLFTGSSERATADALYSEKSKVADDFFKPMTTRSPSGEKFIDPSKIKRLVKTGDAAGDQFEQRASAVKDFVRRQKGELGDLPDVSESLDGIDQLRGIGRMQRLQETANRASGGPTGQGANLIAQAALGGLTGGAYLPLQAATLPVTNPAGWARLVDGAASIMEKVQGSKFAKVLSGVYEQRGPAAVAAAHGVLIKRDPAYQKMFEEISSVKDAKVGFDDYLTKNVVEPMAKAGHEDLGAALASIPSAMFEMAPSSPIDLSPMTAVVLPGKLPWRKFLTPKKAKVLRESFDMIGGITGKTTVYAVRVPGIFPPVKQWGLLGEVAEYDAKATRQMTPHDAVKRGSEANYDTWAIYDAAKNQNAPSRTLSREAKPIGIVEIDWSKGSPVSYYYENFSKGEHKGIVQSFLTKFVDRVGEVSSSMNYKATKTRPGDAARFRGKEMWENNLPNAVQVEGDKPGEHFYRMLSDDKFKKWMKANPNAHEQKAQELRDYLMKEVFKGDADAVEKFMKSLEKAS